VVGIALPAFDAEHGDGGEKSVPDGVLGGTGLAALGSLGPRESAPLARLAASFSRKRGSC
jgi:hypothetical protein